MAKEYIEREAAIRIAHGFCHPANIEDEIEKLPAADVAPVVRCKDCRYSIREDEYELWCNGFCNPARLVREVDYCSHGAVKAEGREVDDGY